MIIRVSVVLRRTVWGDIDWPFDNLSGSHHRSKVSCELSVGVIILWSFSWLVDDLVMLLVVSCHGITSWLNWQTTMDFCAIEIIKLLLLLLSRDRSPFRTHPDDHNLPTHDPSFKLFTVNTCCWHLLKCFSWPSLISCQWKR